MNDTPAWENVVLLLAAFALWPRFILHWSGAVWTVLCYATLAALVVILLRRLLRFRRMLEEKRRGGQ